VDRATLRGTLLTAPTPTTYIQGQGAVTADGLNTMVQTCANVAQALSVTGVPGMCLNLLGLSTPADGGQGLFYWNASTTTAGDNVSIIAPPGAGGTGAWVRIPNNGLSFLVPSGGDDTILISNASANGTVFLTAGAFKITGSLSCNGPVIILAPASLTTTAAASVFFNDGFSAPLHRVFGPNVTAAFAAQFTAVGFPEWWGAIANDAAIDCQPALTACYTACAVTQLQAGNYFTLETWVCNISNRLVRGYIVPSQTAPTSQILINSGSLDAIYVGTLSDPGSINSMVNNIAFRQVAAGRYQPVIPPTVGNEIDAPSGFKVRYVNNCLFEDCFGGGSFGHATCFNMANIVGTKFIRCTVFRSAPGTIVTNDIYWGMGMFGIGPYFLESITLDSCNGSQPYNFVGSGSTGTSIGIAASSAFTDCAVVDCEFNGFQYGIWVNSVTAQSYPLANTDCIISRNRFDQCQNYGILYQSAWGGTVRITDNFFSMQSSGTNAVAGIGITTNAGVVTMANNEGYGDASTAVGLKITGGSTTYVCATSDFGSVFNDFIKPITVNGGHHIHLYSVIHQTSQAVTGAACALTGVVRGKIEIVLFGDSVGLVPAGVTIDTGSSFVEVACSGIDAVCLPGGASATKLVLLPSTNITSAGAFNTNCLASGIMG